MSRPNLLLFTPDQLRADAVGCFGNPAAHTPNVDSLAARGARFDSAWSQHSACAPSRVSFMTGWYPHVAGHRTLDNLLAPEEPNLLRLLGNAGYNVALPGHRGDVFAPGVTEASTDFCGFLDTPQVGFADLRVAHGPDHPLTRGFYLGRQGEAPRVDVDEATTRTAIRWLEEGLDDRPWAMWVPLFAPHPPFMVEDPWFSMHDRAGVPLPIPAEAGVGKPAFMEEYRRRYGWQDLAEEHLREITATYYGMVSRVDDQLGRILAAVDRVGTGDDTVVVFFTDHGEYLGDHGLVEKWPSGLDPALMRNPLVVAGPGVAEGSVVAGEVELVDLLATCLELAEEEASHSHFGRSLTGLLADPASPHRDAAFCEGGFNPADEHLFEEAGWLYRHKGEIQHEMPHLVGKAVCVRTSSWSFVYRVEEGDELYDRVADPSEVVNLLATDRSDDQEVVDTVAGMRDRLLGWLVETGDVVGWTKDPRFPEIRSGWRHEAQVLGSPF